MSEGILNEDMHWHTYLFQVVTKFYASLCNLALQSKLGVVVDELQ